MKRLPVFLFLSTLIASLVLYVACKPSSAPPAPGRPIMAMQSSTSAVSVSTGVGGTCPLGFHQADPQTATCSTDFAAVPMPGDAGTILLSVPLAYADVGFFTFQTDTTIPGAITATGHAWNQGKWGLTYESDSGLMLDPTGADAGISVQTQAGSLLSGQSVYWSQSGNLLNLVGICPTSCAITGNVDYKRQAQSPWVLAVSPTSCNNLTGCTVTVTTTLGGAQNASSATFGAQVASVAGVNTLSGGVVGRCSPVSTDTTQSTATCTIAPLAASLSDGGLAPSGAVSMVSAANPFPFYAAGFSFTSDAGVTDSGPADSGSDAADASDSGSDSGPSNVPLAIFPNEALATGGTVHSYTFSNSGTCGSGTPTVTVGGVSATSVTCTSGAGTFVSPANSVGNGGLNGTNTNLAVVWTTTSGACPSGCTSAATANSVRYFDQNVAALAWYRSDSFPSGPTQWGSDGGTWPDLSGNGLSLSAFAGSGNTTPNTNLSALNGAVAVQYRTSAGNATYAASTLGLDAGARSCVAGSAFSVASVICPTLSAAQQGFAGVATQSTNPSPGTNITSTVTATGGGSDYSTAATSGANNSIVSGSCYRLGYVANGGSTFAITGSTATTGTAGSMGTPAQVEIGGGGTLPTPTFYANGLVVDVLMTCGAVTQAALQRQLNVMQTTWTGTTPVL